MNSITIELINKALHCAREINHLLIVEKCTVKAIDFEYTNKARPPSIIKQWCQHDEAVWQLRMARNVCVRYARCLRGSYSQGLSICA